jgi:hypothetical protein
MESVDQLTLVIRLHRVNKVQAGSGSCCCNRGLDLGEGGGAVGPWLALTEQIQVGAAQQKEPIASGMGAGSCAQRREFNTL